MIKDVGTALYVTLSSTVAGKTLEALILAAINSHPWVQPDTGT